MPSGGKGSGGLSFANEKKAFDPTLASLFASSLGPVKAPEKSRYQSIPKSTADKQINADEDDEVLSSLGSAEENSLEEDDEDESESEAEPAVPKDEEASGVEDSESGDEKEEALDDQLQESVTYGSRDQPHKKRKRRRDEEDIEDVYMRKLAREEAKEDKRLAAQKAKERRELANGEDGDPDEGSVAPESGAEDSDDEVGDTYTIPKHETLESTKGSEDLEKAARTVFLGNVSSEAITSKSAKKTLLRHLASFIPSLPPHDPPHKVASLRFRSTAFASAIPKKAAFAKKELLDATTKSTNAYAVYSTNLAAREAAKRLNGTVVLDRHVRVDEIAHPAKTDHRRCVFVGNLGFVDDESVADQDGEKKKKKKPAGDVEEGLWVQFGKAGKVESVRVVRDSKTRVGKGFAYVQFIDENGVEAALQFNDQKFPPLLPRKLRVVRAKGQKRNAKKSTERDRPDSKSVYNRKVTEQERSMKGRATKLFGRAGAAQLRNDRNPSGTVSRPVNGAFKSPEQFVFEGHRASSKQGTSGLKIGGKKKGGKPKSRSSKRGTAWKASGGKRPGK